jgi:3-oxo-5alpha-steroid 4-dehydrogenase
MTSSQPYDLIVVGMGAAGVCAAIEAAERGLDVLIVDRFAGGGATAISGGVVYAGGGTSIQHEAGIGDSPEAMFQYLKLETQGVVSDDTLRRFCETSPEMIEWLRQHGVPFEASLCPDKTSYPSNDYYLYYSGNESFSPFKEAARPAPRGHRAVGKGLPGANFFSPLKSAARAAGVTLLANTRAGHLIGDDDAVTGLAVRHLKPGLTASLHLALERWAVRINPYVPRWARRLRRLGDRLHRRFAQDLELKADAVALTSGGFIYNRKRVRSEAPNYRRGMPLGTVGCDGSGIAMGEAMGGQTQAMNRISAWRFINPPLSFAQGILVDAQGKRFVNEALYGAALGEAIVEQAQGQAYLILDDQLVRSTRSQLGRGKTHWFQTAPALLNLWFGARKAQSLNALAAQLKIDPETLSSSVKDYNELGSDPMGKPDDFRAQLTQGPFRAVDCSITSKWFPLPTLTLGGLVVDEASGQVLRKDNTPIQGLYAAGRAALGVCSRQYVSGLSIADCVFSGRRIGQALTKPKG